MFEREKERERVRERESEREREREREAHFRNGGRNSLHFSLFLLRVDKVRIGALSRLMKSVHTSELLLHSIKR